MRNKLQELIGTTVTAYLEFKTITGSIENVKIEDYYFYEKNEPIYITVDLKPLNGYGSIKNVDEQEEWLNIPLDYIRLN